MINDDNNNTDYRTDYMADVIANSEKLKPEENRIKFDKNKAPDVIHQIQDSVVETDDDYFDERSKPEHIIINGFKFFFAHVSNIFEWKII